MSGADWQAALLSFRARKDDHFRSGRGPVAAPDLPSFSGLAYFAPDPAWNLTLPVNARLLNWSRCPPPPPARRGGLSPGARSPCQHHLSTQETLTLYAREGDDAPETLFVPFRDATSGQTTYGAGRYLDAPLVGEQVTLDFNRAYQPYCAYSDAWTCPLPPAENWLRVKVEAGEKLPRRLAGHHRVKQLRQTRFCQGVTASHKR